MPQGTRLVHKETDNSLITLNFAEIIKSLGTICGCNFDLIKIANMVRIRELLDKIDGFFIKSLSKHELNTLTRQLVIVMRRVESSFYAVLDNALGSITDEMLINILSVENRDATELKKIELLLDLGNKILELFLVITKFNEKWENGLIAKGIYQETIENKCTKVKQSISRDTALELGNLTMQLFENVRNNLLNVASDLQKNQVINMVGVNRYLISSFCLLCSISPNANHTICLNIEKERIFFIINYVLNRNSEYVDYFLTSFSKICDSDDETSSGEEKRIRVKIVDVAGTESKASEQYFTQKNHSIESKNMMELLYDWALRTLNLEQFNFKNFFKDQFVKNASNSAIQNIILAKRNHKFIVDIGKFAIMRIFNNKNVHDAFLKTYNSSNVKHTIQVVEDMFKISHKSGERILKDLIIEKRLPTLHCLFYDKCVIIDSAYIECLFICKNHLNHLKFEMLEKLLDSYYLTFLIRDKIVFEKITLRISDYVLFLRQKRRNFDFDKFFINLVEKMVLNREEEVKDQITQSFSNINYASISISNLTVNLRRKSVEKHKNHLNNMSFEVFERSLFFLNAFPEILQHILPFLHELLVTFNKEYKFYRDFKGEERYNFSNTTFVDDDLTDTNVYGSLTSLQTESVVYFSQIFNNRNTITICQILNLTRDYIEEWNFTDLLLKLNLRLLLENVIFSEERKMDSLFLHALQTILDNISEIVNDESKSLECCKNHSDCKLETNTGNSAGSIDNSVLSSISNQECRVLDIIYTNLRKMFVEKSEYHTYMILKKINFESLYRLDEFKMLLEKNEDNVNNCDAKIVHNFYGGSNDEKFSNVSSLSGNKSILAKKPIGPRDSNSLTIKNNQDTEQKEEIDQSFAAKGDNLLNAENTTSNTLNEPPNAEILPNLNRSGEYDPKNLNICDIDDTFSNITLNNQKIKTKIRHDQAHLDLKVELLTSNQKRHLLELELSKNVSDKEVVSKCLRTLLHDYKYVSGLVFNRSKVTIRKKLSSFCLYCNLYQYSKIGDQLLFRITTPNGYTALIVRNGQLLKILVEKDAENIILLPSPVNNLYTLGLEYNNKVLKINVNEIKLPVTIKRANSLDIGENFRGIIPRILYYENMSYNDKYFENLDNISYYAKYINELERKCQYYSHDGVLVDSLQPYFLSKNNFDVCVNNLMVNVQYDFLNSENFARIYLEKLKRVVEFRSILEQYYLDYNT